MGSQMLSQHSDVEDLSLSKRGSLDLGTSLIMTGQEGKLQKITHNCHPLKVHLHVKIDPTSEQAHRLAAFVYDGVMKTISTYADGANTKCPKTKTKKTGKNPASKKKKKRQTGKKKKIQKKRTSNNKTKKKGGVKHKKKKKKKNKRGKKPKTSKKKGTKKMTPKEKLTKKKKRQTGKKPTSKTKKIQKKRTSNN